MMTVEMEFRDVAKWLKSAAIAALMLVPASAGAAAGQAVQVGQVAQVGQVQVAQAGVASQATTERAITAFYAARGNAPLWLRDGRDDQAAVELIAILRRAMVDGMTDGAEVAAEVEQALRAARRGDPRAVMAAERTMSTAWVAYVQAVRAPTRGMIYGDPGMQATRPQAPIILRDAARAPSLTAYMTSVSRVNPTYAALRDAALAGLQAGGGAPSRVMLDNLDRARAIPADGRFVLVDAAAQLLWMYDNGRVSGTMKVIVGKPGAQYATPMIASVMHYTTLNPYWHVPDHLVREIVAAGVIKQGTNYLKQRGYEVVSEYSDRAEVLSPASVDWKKVAAGTVKTKVRQLPGPTNSMGKMKFSFANGEGIYLHDTPDRDLFSKDQRTLSNGCVRVEDAPRLARWLMGSDPVAVGPRPEQHVRLPQGVPIYITYLTAKPEGGTITYGGDVYGRDGPAEDPLAARTAAIR